MRNSEWNRFIYPSHENDPDGLMWNINYNDVDLDTVNAPVSYMIETGGSGAYVRGGSSLTYSGTWLTNSTATNRGWRPVLRDITPI
jgi:hypothetical protein